MFLGGAGGSSRGASAQAAMPCRRRTMAPCVTGRLAAFFFAPFAAFFATGKPEVYRGVYLVATTYNNVIHSGQSMTPKRPLKAFRIDEDLEEGLQQVWDRDGIAVSEQIRRAIRQWLEQKGVVKKPER